MSARFSVNNGSVVWYNTLKMNASVHFGYGGQAAADRGGSEYVTGK